MSASLDKAGFVYWAGCGCGGKKTPNTINPLATPTSTPPAINTILPVSPPGGNSVVIPATPAPTPGRTVVIVPPRRRQASGYASGIAVTS